MKKCFKCGAEMPLTEFYAHKKMADGHLNKCKSCAKEDVKRHRRENESVRKYDRERSKRPERREKNIEHTRTWRERNPEKYAAQTKVGNAIRSGTLKRLPCEVCGEKKVHAHHDDYSKPMNVTWLCALHHHRHHAESRNF